MGRVEWFEQRGYVAVYAVVAALAYAAGANGLLEFGAPGPEASTPLARVGYAVHARNLQVGPSAWANLAADVEAVRPAFAPHEQAVFELVVALRGLRNSGVSNFADAEQACRALGWPRCDRAALEAIKQRSKP